MDFEKRSSKGSFLKLFDWNVRSRKKLFSSKSELSEMSMSTQENGNVNGFTFSRLQQVHENGNSSGSGIKERCNLSNEFPLSNDETYGTKAPGVVARLMGLDSLPTSNNVESCFPPFWDSPSFGRDSPYTAGIPGSEDEKCIVNGDRMRNKLDGFGRNPVELTVHSQPNKRFQTEVLPPKSAKPISITHHRLLSPIKTPGFVPTMNVTSLMEAAGKMIEQSPRKRVTQKLPSLGSSSVPFQIQDLKDRVEAVEKSRRIIDSSHLGKQRNFSKYTNGHASSSVVGRVDSPDLLRADRTVKTVSCEDVKRKTKAATLAVQGKANIQKRDVLISKGDQGSANLWPQHNEAKAKHGFVGRSQEEKRKNALKKTPANRKSDALRQNNQKQNCLSTEEKEKKSSSVALSRPSKRILLSNDSLSKKENSHDTHDLLVKIPSSNSSRTKQEVKRNTVSSGGNVASLSQSCSYEIRKVSKRESADQKNGMDAVSFTFTSPIKKSVPEATLSGKQVESKRNLFLIPDSCNSQSSLGLDMGGSDALSVLLEEKIKELTCQVDASTDSAQTVGTISFQASSEWNSKCDLPGGKTNTCSTFDVSSSSSLSEPRLESMQKRQELDEVKRICKVKHNEQEPQFEYSMPISSLELSYSEGSCKSLDSSKSISSEGWSTNGTDREEVDTELFDSVSSTSVKTTSTTDVTSGFATSILKDSCIWGFRYIRSLLFSTDLMLEEFALGQVQKIIPLNIFDQLENEKSVRNPNVKGGDLKVTRKNLFDCVEESLESWCLLLLSGDRKQWMKVTMLFHQKDWLADELYREISGWTSNGEEVMVDEVVHKDMSSQLGSWVNFEVEAFEEVVDIGEDILTFLVDEMITDMLL